VLDWRTDALVALDGRVDAVAGLDVGTGYVGRLLMLAPPRNGDLWSPRRRLMLLAVRGLTSAAKNAFRKKRHFNSNH